MGVLIAFCERCGARVEVKVADATSETEAEGLALAAVCGACRVEALAEQARAEVSEQQGQKAD